MLTRPSVEHDFTMATYLSSRVIVFEGTPAVESWARKPEGLLTGMNRFLSSLQITFVSSDLFAVELSANGQRRDPTNFRPRINKFNSVLDKEQKAEGAYFFVGDD